MGVLFDCSILYIYIYDRKFNLNSYIYFLRSWGLNSHPHRGVEFFEKRDYHWTEYSTNIDNSIVINLNR